MKTNEEGRRLIAFFESEYEPAESRTAAEKAVNMMVQRRLTGNQFSALVCFVMYTGISGFKTSQMLKLLNTRSVHSAVQAAEQFGYYIYETDDKGDRYVDPFLIKQRELEKALFLTPEIVQKRRMRK